MKNKKDLCSYYRQKEYKSKVKITNIILLFLFLPNSGYGFVDLMYRGIGAV